MGQTSDSCKCDPFDGEAYRRLLYPIWFYLGTTEVILLYAAVDM